MKRSTMNPASPAPVMRRQAGIAEYSPPNDRLDQRARPGEGVQAADHRPDDEDRREPDLRADPIDEGAGRNLPDHHAEVEGYGDVGVLRVASTASAGCRPRSGRAETAPAPPASADRAG